MNLLVQGFEDAADAVKSRLLKRRGASYCYVVLNGDVYLPAAHEDLRYSGIDDTMLVGTYTRDTPIEVIENDLLLRQRELFDAMTKRNNTMLAVASDRS